MGNKKYICLFCSLLSQMLHAQTSQMMPEGSTDIDLGIAALIAPSREGSDKQKFYLLPFASAVWSNGVFLAPGELGMRLPSPGHMQYGPLLSYELQQRGTDRNTTTSLVLSPGVFFNYRLDQQLGFRSRLNYGTGTQQRGMRLLLASWFNVPLAPHQSLSAEMGASLVSQPYMQVYFGLAPDEHQPGYMTKAGIKNTYLQIGWNMELSAKYDFSTRISINKLWGSAANSPLTTRTNTLSLLTALIYHY